ncbi:MAG: transcriptional regulator BetI [Rhodobacteraceae bacterium]|jgi:TetR/AcrR family transcriptional repressor of bet genes|nr:transcriptional regulator BetI [Paracoccaceae bacterium]
MPKLGMEPIRRAALVKATIEAIGRAGTLDVTVGQIARAAGMSSALAHHYFGAKEALFLAAMRQVLADYGAAVRAGLRAAGSDPRARLGAIVAAGFEPRNFRREAVGAWLTFYMLAQSVPGARRLLGIYQRRLASNLVHALRPLAGARAEAVAGRLGAMIDGVYLREALGEGPPDGAAAEAAVLAHLAAELGAGPGAAPAAGRAAGAAAGPPGPGGRQ